MLKQKEPNRFGQKILTKNIVDQKNLNQEKNFNNVHSFFPVVLVNSLPVKIFKAESYNAMKEPNENKV